MTDLQSPDPPQGAKSFWAGISHNGLIDLLYKKMDKGRWEPSNLLVHHNRAGTNLIASFDFEVFHPFPFLDEGLTPFFGVTNSLVRFHSIRFYAGIRLHEGTEVIFHDDFICKHTRHGMANLERNMTVAIKYGWQTIKRTPSLIRQLKKEVISPMDTKDLLYGAGRKRWMPWSRVGLVDEMFLGLWPTKWNLICCFAKVARMNPAFERWKQIYKFTNVVMSLGGVS